MARYAGVHSGSYDASAATDIWYGDSMQGPITYLNGSADAIPPHIPGNYVVITGGVDAMTLAAPTAGTDDGLTINVWSQTAQAHTITATALVAAGVSAKTTITFPAFAGSGCTLRAINGLWHLVGGGGSATNGGPVVLT